jgi:ubiquinone/menaquinone biosynthesis C-methylase UbiE
MQESVSMKFFDVKTVIVTPLIKLVLKHPNIMKTKIFMKAMIYFPDKISKSYDKKIQESETDYKASIIEGLENININPEKILDLGTGTGVTALLAAKKFPKAEVIGIDQSKNMVEISKKKAEKEGLHNIEFKIDNASDLSFNDDEFDLLVTSNAPIYLSEASRILRPGGNFLVAFSFSGKALIDLEEDITEFIQEYRFKLLKLSKVKEGAYILVEKYN